MMRKFTFLFGLCGLMFLAGCDLSSNLFGRSEDTQNEKNSDTTAITKTVKTNTDTVETDSVIAYNGALIDLLSSCVEAEENFYDELDSDDEISDDFFDIFEDAVLSCSNATTQLEKYRSFEGDTSFADAIQEYLDVENQIFDLYSEYFSLDEDLSDEDEEQFWETMSDLESASSTLYEQIITAQETFAQNHDFELLEDE